jgi:thiol-disulfide isomerase/thioredoxin
MARLLLLWCLAGSAVVLAGEPAWLTDLDAGLALGVKENKPLLVDFTGSDWCPPCKALHKNVFESAEFAAVASRYVLVELDYPRTKPQDAAVKARNREWQQKFAITGFPTVLLIDARSGDVFGKTVGFGGQSAKDYLDKLATFKNTPEGKASLAKEQASEAIRATKSRELGQKINAAIAAKDFQAAEAALSEIFAEVNGPRKGVFHYNKARILLQIDPTAKEQALKYLDEALAAAAGDAALTKSFQAYRDKVSSGKSTAPKVPVDSQKGA